MSTPGLTGNLGWACYLRLYERLLAGISASFMELNVSHCPELISLSQLRGEIAESLLFVFKVGIKARVWIILELLISPDP